MRIQDRDLRAELGRLQRNFSSETACTTRDE
jgi:hypothetical protein